MAEYHKYVFDTKNQKFVGKFEEMYQQETLSNFDSWHQDDSRQLSRKITLELLNAWNFRTIIDIGSGKGALTHQLKKRNNEVTGLDISQTATKVAQSRFPDIHFETVDVSDTQLMRNYLERRKSSGGGGGADLFFTSECLSYLENWKQLLHLFSEHAKFLLVSLYVPETPIGFVKSIRSLEEEIEQHFDILESVHLTYSNMVVIFSKSNAI